MSPIDYLEPVQLSLEGAQHVLRPAQAACPYCAGIGTLTATDMFCGAGGSSLGLEFVCCPVCGRQLIEVKCAINHWDLAVEVHNANFPEADHDLHSVQDIAPSRFRRTDLAWFSPECVNHTACKGARDDSPEARRSRATFKDIVRFTAYHRYDMIFVENVVEARLWCEHEDCACGHEFNKWYRAMLAEGYEGKVVYFNSQFALPTPQSRDRMYVVFWRVGLPAPNLDLQPLSWCTNCTMAVNGVQTFKKASKGSARDLHVFEWGRYGSNYVYRCPNAGCGQAVSPAVIGAKSIIDFALPIEQIKAKPARHCNTCGKRHPVACNTRKRIKVGWQNIGSRVPVGVQVGGNLYERDGYARVWALEDPLKTVTGTSTTALVTADRDGNVPSPVQTPTPALTTHAQLGLVLRVGGQSPAPTDVSQPMSTITAHDRQIGLVIQNMTNNVAQSVDEPTPPVTTGGNHMLVQCSRGGSGGRRHVGVDEPMPTIAGHGEHAVVEMRNHGAMSTVDEPVRTVVSSGTHHGLLLYNGNPGFVRALGDALGTITARDKQSLVVPEAAPLIVTDADVDDAYLRMLQWEELLRAQVMHRHPNGAAYLLTARRRNARGKMVELSNELRTKMIGNAVSCPVATMLGQTAIEVLR